MKKIGIIGGGASGICLAYNISKYLPNWGITVLEEGELAGGLAFGNIQREPILNVAVENMSLDCFEPLHFQQWLFHHGLSSSDFPYWPYVNRHLYRQYLLEYFKVSNAHLINERALKIAKEGLMMAIYSQSGVTHVDHVVLATGYTKPSLFLNSPRVFECSQFKVSDIQPEDRILVVGSGLSAFDVYQIIKFHEFYKCDFLSRRGLIPLPHLKESKKLDLKYLKTSSLKEILKEFRRLNKTSSWQDIADSFKGHITEVWPGFTQKERCQFKRLVRPYWSAIRHRLPFGVWEEFNQDERIRVLKGRITAVEESKDSLKVTLKLFGKTRVEEYQKVIQATGQIVEKQFSDLSGEFITRLGPSLHDQLWETNSIPNIREQILQFISKIKG